MRIQCQISFTTLCLELFKSYDKINASNLQNQILRYDMDDVLKIENKLGIEETLDIANCFKEIVDDLIEQKNDDGKLTASEIGQVAAENAMNLFEAFWGSDKAMDEIAELTLEEKEEILDIVLPAAMKLIRVFV